MIPLHRSDASETAEGSSEEISIRALHLPLTPALRMAAIKKVAWLLRHHLRPTRIRIDLEQDEARLVVAKGRIELADDELVASVESDGPHTALGLLVDQLARLLGDRAHGRKPGADFLSSTIRPCGT